MTFYFHRSICNWHLKMSMVQIGHHSIMMHHELKRILWQIKWCSWNQKQKYQTNYDWYEYICMYSIIIPFFTDVTIFLDLIFSWEEWFMPECSEHILSLRFIGHFPSQFTIFVKMGVLELHCVSLSVRQSFSPPVTDLGRSHQSYHSLLDGTPAHSRGQL